MSSQRTQLRRIAPAVAAVSLFLAGCGNAYRPVVSAISPVGPAQQPTKYAIAVTSNGMLSVVDYSGDTLVATAELSANPVFFNLGASSDAYILHCSATYDPTVEASSTTATPGQPAACTSGTNGVIDAISVSNKIMTKDVYQTSLPSGAKPNTIVPFTNNVYTAEAGTSTVGVFATGQPPTAQQEIPVTANPVYIVTRSGSSWHYALSQGTTPGTSTGVALPILATTNVAATAISVGKTPVYGVMNSDTRRAYIVNRGSGTVSVINTQTNALDLTAPTITVGTNPIWAATADNLNELVVLNQGDGTSNGSVTIVSIPMCSTTTQTTNNTCDPNNPTVATGFGTELKTIPVGINPYMVTILQDQNKAYVSNRGSSTISVIDLNTLTKTKDIAVSGRPTWVAATTGNPTGKVYVISPDNNYMQIIYTETDTLQSTQIDLQGKGVGLRLSAQ